MTTPQPEPPSLDERIAAAEREASTLRHEKLQRDVATAKGIPAKHAARLRGTTREELEADADVLAGDLPQPTAPPIQVTQAPRENLLGRDLRGGGKPYDDPDETDPRKLAARIPR